MAKKTPIKYTVLVGCNAPDPSGARNANGRPLEVRFEAGTEIDETAVTPVSLAALLSIGAVRPSEPAFAVTLHGSEAVIPSEDAAN